MTVIVNSGTTLTVTSGGLIIGADGTVASGGLLDGSGVIGGGILLNLGTLSADVPGGTLIVNTTTLTNSGTVFANNASLTINAAVATTNLAGTTLTGGVWKASGTGTVAFLAGSVVTDDASITLIGPASAVDGFDTAHGTLQPIENSLTAIGASGVLDLESNRSFLATNSLVIDGAVALGGGVLGAPVSGMAIGPSGTVAGFGTVDPGSVVNNAGTIRASGGTLTVPQAGILTGTGTLAADPGASLVLQAFGGSYGETIVNNGTIDAAFAGLSGTLDMTGLYSGTGGFLVLGGFDGADRTILELPSGLSANVAFDANFGELLLDGPNTFSGTLSGFGDNDRIVMRNVSGAATASLTGNALNLLDSADNVLQTLTLNTGSLNYQSAAFAVIENPSDTQATVTVLGTTACFAAGTRIKTRNGEVAVENLVAGDVLHAHFAGTAPVVWIGRRRVDCNLHAEPSKVWPVRVSAHAFGPRLPHRDLVLSPDHAVFVDGVLIPIRLLANGKTIVREKVDTVTYYHVELGEHDVLLAEGMPAESYLETGNRAAFDNAGDVVALHPDFGSRRWEAFGCAPLVLTGAKLEAVAAMLAARTARRRPEKRRSRGRS